ncbi:hypothetical protein LLEC1_03371 [Akanthomyces lecanii]|uniref:Amino acid transporter transmembrane domain-containing protein n=1 Tax=Cordyceps confragosa TaxID=2714763 RepID=A0A179II54_CORDF|nr:hypothetical protein LLEC1_03371 [Akanthomyces lecanii]
MNRPMNQNILCGLYVALVCAYNESLLTRPCSIEFPSVCPEYTPLTALGAGGGKPSSSVIANQTNAILYVVFIVFRLSLMIGTPWLSSVRGWSTVLRQHGQFLIPSVGAAIAFAVNYGRSKPLSVSSAVYIVFIVLQISPLLLFELLIVDPTDVVRKDGAHLARIESPTSKAEIRKLQKCFTDKRILLLTPGMIVCEMPLGTLSTGTAVPANETLVGAFLDLRPRALASICFQIIQVIDPLLLVWIFDSKKIGSRKVRRLLGVGSIGVVAVGTCIGMYIWLFAVNYDKLEKPPGRDWDDTFCTAGCMPDCKWQLAGVLLRFPTTRPSSLSMPATRGHAQLLACASVSRLLLSLSLY